LPLSSATKCKPSRKPADAGRKQSLLHADLLGLHFNPEDGRIVEESIWIKDTGSNRWLLTKFSAVKSGR
jgi:hypothetical protein